MGQINEIEVIRILEDCKPLAARLAFAGEYIELDEADFSILARFYYLLEGQDSFNIDELELLEIKAGLEKGDVRLLAAVMMKHFNEIKLEIAAACRAVLTDGQARAIATEIISQVAVWRYSFHNPLEGATYLGLAGVDQVNQIINSLIKHTPPESRVHIFSEDLTQFQSELEDELKQRREQRSKQLQDGFVKIDRRAARYILSYGTNLIATLKSIGSVDKLSVEWQYILGMIATIRNYTSKNYFQLLSRDAGVSSSNFLWLEKFLDQQVSDEQLLVSTKPRRRTRRGRRRH